MKIPTLLGLFVLFMFVVGLIFATVYFQKLTKIAPSMQIFDLETGNTTDTSTSVAWFSHTPIQTQIFLGNSKDFSTLGMQPTHDDRDQKSTAKRYTHLVTFKDLNLGQSYFVKAEDDSKNISSLQSEFTTLAQKPPSSNNTTFVGSVVSQNLQPVNDALVIFNQIGNNIIVAVNDQGTYLLPINTSTNPVSFTITNGSLKSQVTVPASYANTPIPAVVLGQNLDLTNSVPTASVSAIPNPNVQGVSTVSASPVSKFDLNEDGAINTLDLDILKRNVGKNEKTDSRWDSIKFMDLNNDGKIDSKDLTLLKSGLH